MATYAEQISAFEATRASRAAELKSLMDDASEKGETLDADAQEQFDTLEGEIDAIDKHLSRLRKMKSMDDATAKPVEGGSAKAASDSRGGLAPVTVKPAAPEPGIRFARYAKCLAISHKEHRPIEMVAESLFSQRDPELVGTIKAAVPAMTTGNMSALIGNNGGFADFVEFLRPMTILGQFGQNGIPGLTRIPFRTPIIIETGDGDAYWVGEGKAKPLTRQTVDRVEMTPFKVATVAVQTMELIADSSPSSDTLLRNMLARAVARRIDQTFMDPTNAGSAGVRPASILNGVTAVASSGNDADAIRADVAALKLAFITANQGMIGFSGVWVMSATTAMYLSAVRNALGVREFPDISERGGRFEGYPVVVSNYVGNYVALVNADDIFIGDEDEIEIKMSTEASLEMADNPTNASDTPTATALVSMFQTNSVAFLAERRISWMRRRASAVAWLSGVAWGQPET